MSDVEFTFHSCSTECSTHFRRLMCYDQELHLAMQASSTATRFVVVAWTWIDPRTELPLFMGEQDLEMASIKDVL